MISKYLDLCADLGVPIATEKTKWASVVVIFLGMLLDGCHLILAVPDDKRELAIQLLSSFCDRKKATVKELQKFCGYLNFIGKAVVLGRAFTRHMYAKYSKVVHLDGAATHKYHHQFKLKQHYHVRLDAEFKLDCRIWLEFLQGHLAEVVNKPMMDLSEKPQLALDIGFTSDASAAEMKGFGATLGMNWIQGL